MLYQLQYKNYDSFLQRHRQNITKVCVEPDISQIKQFLRKKGRRHCIFDLYHTFIVIEYNLEL